jgi:hypothetical protein
MVGNLSRDLVPPLPSCSVGLLRQALRGCYDWRVFDQREHLTKTYRERKSIYLRIVFHDLNGDSCSKQK